MTCFFYAIHVIMFSLVCTANNCCRRSQYTLIRHYSDLIERGGGDKQLRGAIISLQVNRVQ